MTDTSVPTTPQRPITEAQRWSPDDAIHFRTALGHFCSGVVVVTALVEGRPVGMTCQSFSSVSLDPPLITFLPAMTSTTYPQLRTAAGFCVNILGSDQQALCRQFAVSGSDKWAGVEWAPGDGGAPHLRGALAWVDATLEAEHPAGDHIVVLGRVTHLATAPAAEPLLFYRGSYGRFQP